MQHYLFRRLKSARFSMNLSLTAHPTDVIIIKKTGTEMLMNEKLKSARFYTNDSYLTPVTVEKNGNKTPVFIQQRWTEGEFSEFIVKNGCGHTCVAMALRLQGIQDITPHDVYTHCRKAWGPPKEEEPYLQGNWLSLTGICKIFKDFCVKAEYIPIDKGKEKLAADRIFGFLKDGKTVIFNSVPNLPDNPFSTGSHYVLAVGITEDGKALVANSSTKGKTSPLGIQTADKATVASALIGGTEHPDNTWGTHLLYVNYAFCVIG